MFGEHEVIHKEDLLTHKKKVTEETEAEKIFKILNKTVPKDRTVN